MLLVLFRPNNIRVVPISGCTNNIQLGGGGNQSHLFPDNLQTCVYQLKNY